METFRKYEEELEINDFPQQARWKVTSKVRFKLKIINIIFKINFEFIILICNIILYLNIIIQKVPVKKYLSLIGRVKVN